MTTMTAGTKMGSGEVAARREKRISLSEPFVWINKGIKDFKRIPGLSLLYGTLFAGLCAAIFFLTLNTPWYTLAYITGLAFVGPFLASGLYAASRDMGRQKVPTMVGSLRLIWERRSNLGLFALLLTLVMAAWVRLSALTFALTFNNLAPNFNVFSIDWIGSEGLITMAYLAAMGVLLAGAVFTISAFTIPRILDLDEGFITAMSRSFQTVIHNLPAMLVWALIIVLMTAAGIATAFIGLALIFPILGYATWHSYQSTTE